MFVVGPTVLEALSIESDADSGLCSLLDLSRENHKENKQVINVA